MPYPPNPGHPNDNPSNWSSAPNSMNAQDQGQATSSAENFLKSKLSRDELQVLSECNTESFYYRCVPLSTLFSGLAYIAMKNGHLPKSPSYGYIPKMCVGAVLGYILGKLSYQSACAEKMMKLPDSNLAEALRRRRGQASFSEPLAPEPQFAPITPSKEFSGDTIFDDVRPDLSEHNDGMDSYNTVTESLSPYSETQEEGMGRNQPYISYEDLRRQNREEYASKMADKYRRLTPEPTRPPLDTSPSFPGSSSAFPDSFPENPRGGSGYRSSSPGQPESYFNPKKNKYGDTLE